MKKLLTLFTLLFVSVSVAFATDYTVEPTTAVKSNTVPIFMSGYASIYGSITQQLFLPSEMKDAYENTPSPGDITKITFYYAVKNGKSAAAAMSRDIEIWLMEIDDDIDAYQYDNTSAYTPLYKSKFFFNASKKAGVKVYDGKLNTNAITIGDGKQSLPLEITPFAWDGESNIVLTLFDKSSSSSQIGSDAYDNLRFYITETTGGRFVHQKWYGSVTDDRATWMNNLDQYGDIYSTPTNTAEAQANTHRYVSLTTFTIESPIPVPSGLSASSITSSSATLNWSTVTGATSYNVRWGKASGSLDQSQNNVATNSLAISGLEDGEKYYFDVQAVTAGGTSAFSSEANFTTSSAPHEHNGISFNKWSNASAMPTSGNYYLSVDIEEENDVTLSGNLNLCLNGKQIFMYGTHIAVPNDKTLAIFDDAGGGNITGGYHGDFEESGLISIKAGGTFIIREGAVVNLADDAEDYNMAIDNKGTLILSGNPTISGVNADIYLGTGKVITIDDELTNSTPYRVDAVGQVITSGWASNMGNANPSQFFSSAKSGFPAVIKEDGEVKLVKSVSLSESENNSSVLDNGTYSGVSIVIAMTRSFTASQFNTICLPFNLTNDQLQDIFGSGYDLKEFTSSELNDEELVLTFSPASALQAGKPYLIKPSVNVSNPVFEGVTISVYEPLSQTSDTYISFIGVFNPTELEGGNKNFLFLGANNELFWPETTGSIKGFRAYFEVKGDARKAVRARIAQQSESTEAVINTSADNKVQKVIRDGQLYLMFEGRMYNVQGQRIQ